MKKESKVRLDQHLVNIGQAPDLTRAQAMIIAGTIELPGVPLPKPGDLIQPEETITIKKSNPYVSRGGLKLESAIKAFSISCIGRVCLDIGASTGGFTDYLLQHGAKKVYAVDVGRGLLDLKLVKNPAVVNMEGVNFRYFTAENLKEKIEFVTIDVSFISLEKILPKVQEILADGGRVVAMVKPQFEASPKDLRKGIVKDEQTRLSIIARLRYFAVNSGFEIISEADSEIKGPKGNIEHFLLLRSIKCI
jgi:23S rRNA (cytidine1920-2'-O)/16S rRNA (cytidine1409-2'-O)-methyltransferase